MSTISSQLSGLSKAALAWAEKGVPVLPVHSTNKRGQCTCGDADCKAPGKHPRIASWNHAATTDERQIRSWWRVWPDANVAGLTGGLFDAVDIEPQYVKEFETLMTNLSLDMSGYPCHRTARGGVHYLCAPTGLKGAMPGYGELKGRDGCILLPPSQIGGREYVEVVPLSGQLPALKPQFVALVTVRGNQGLCSNCPHPSVPNDEYFEKLLDRLAETGEGDRNNSLNRASYSIGRWLQAAQLDREAYEERLISAAEANGLLHGKYGLNAAKKTIQSGLDAGTENPHVVQRMRITFKSVKTAGTEPEPNVLSLRTADEAEPEAIEWWWQDHIPVGKFGLLDGDPGLGKSVILCDLIASATAGRSLPDGSPPLKVGGAVLFAAEDGYKDTILPRLIAAGADLSKVLVAHAADYGSAIRLPNDLKAVDAFISRVDAILLAFDPWEFYLDADIIKGKEQRVKFEPVKKFIADKGVVLIGTRHLNQQSGQRALYRGRGDITAIGMARYGFIVGDDPSPESENQEIDKVMVPLKYNLAPRSRVHGVRYSIDEVTLKSSDKAGQPITAAHVKWNGRTAVTADRAVEGLSRGQPLTARQVIEFEVLPLLRQNGPMKADDGWATLEAHGIRGKGNVNSACKALGIHSSKEGMSGPWWWYLDGQQDRLPGQAKVTIEPKVTIDASGRRIRTIRIASGRVLDFKEHS